MTNSFFIIIGILIFIAWVYGELYGSFRKRIVLGLFFYVLSPVWLILEGVNNFYQKRREAIRTEITISFLTATLDALKEGRNQDLYNQLQYLKKQLELRNPYEVDNSLNNYHYCPNVEFLISRKHL